MSRVFDGTDDEVRFPVQTGSNFTGAWSFACWIKVAANGTWLTPIMHHTSGGTAAAGFFRAGTVVANSIAAVVNGFGNMYSTETVVTGDGWVLVGVSRAGGPTSVARLHVLQSAVWTHQDMTAPGSAASQGNAPSQSGGTIRLGESEDGDDFNGKMASDAGWAANLTDGNYEALTADMATWVGHSVPPAYCHQHTQASPSDPILDLMGNGHDSSVITGTTMDGADNPSGWTPYGAAADPVPPPLVMGPMG